MWPPRLVCCWSEHVWVTPLIWKECVPNVFPMLLHLFHEMSRTWGCTEPTLQKPRALPSWLVGRSGTSQSYDTGLVTSLSSCKWAHSTTPYPFYFTLQLNTVEECGLHWENPSTFLTLFCFFHPAKSYSQCSKSSKCL